MVTVPYVSASPGGGPAGAERRRAGRDVRGARTPTSRRTPSSGPTPTPATAVPAGSTVTVVLSTGSGRGAQRRRAAPRTRPPSPPRGRRVRGRRASIDSDTPSERGRVLCQDPGGADRGARGLDGHDHGLATTRSPRPTPSPTPTARLPTETPSPTDGESPTDAPAGTAGQRPGGSRTRPASGRRRSRTRSRSAGRGLAAALRVAHVGRPGVGRRLDRLLRLDVPAEPALVDRLEVGLEVGAAVDAVAASRPGRRWPR